MGTSLWPSHTGAAFNAASARCSGVAASTGGHSTDAASSDRRNADCETPSPANACNGPAGIDVAHCAVNLSALFGVPVAEAFREAYEAVAGEEMELGLGDLCLFGIRNDSDDRAIAIRLGEELRTVAIGIDSRLQSGLTIGPGHEVMPARWAFVP